jgi:hypothetical protein
MGQLNKTVQGYYDSLPDAQCAEESAWGEFAETEFAGAEP